MFLSRIFHLNILVAIPLIMVGLWLTPDWLASVGLMDRSLASELPLVRETALLEIKIARAGAVALGILMVLVGLFWPEISSHSAFRRFMALNLAPPEIYDLRLREMWSFSLKYLLAAMLVCWLYLGFGEQIFSLDTLARINLEDGFIESVSALILFAASIVSLCVAVQMRGMRPRKVMHGFLALLFFAMCGEEISWGQRIFGFETPEDMATVNVQNEFNLHNMYGYLFDHLFILLFFVWGCVVPVLNWWSEVFRQIFRMTGLPVPGAGLALGMLLITLTQDQIVFKFTDGIPGLRIPEMRELLSSVAFILLMRESYRGLVGGRRGLS